MVKPKLYTRQNGTLYRREVYLVLDEARRTPDGDDNHFLIYPAHIDEVLARYSNADELIHEQVHTTIERCAVIFPAMVKRQENESSYWFWVELEAWKGLIDMTGGGHLPDCSNEPLVDPIILVDNTLW